MLQQETRRAHEQVSARLAGHEIERIEQIVASGYCLNTSDFVRIAVREKLQSFTVAQARKPRMKEAQQEILSYLEGHDQAYASDIATELGLDIDLVFAVLKTLQQTGEVK